MQKTKNLVQCSIDRFRETICVLDLNEFRDVSLNGLTSFLPREQSPFFVSDIVVSDVRRDQVR